MDDSLGPFSPYLSGYGPDSGLQHEFPHSHLPRWLNTSYRKSELIGTFLETLGFGIYIVILAQTLAVLRRRHGEGNAVGYLFATTMLIFICVLQHWIADLIREIEAFTGQMDQVNGPLKYYAIVATPLNMWKTASYIVLTQIVDLFIIYRTFVVYGRRLAVVALPLTLWICVVVTSAWATASLATVPTGNNVLLSTVTLRIKYFYVLSVALNIICTTMISVKVWLIMRVLAKHSAGKSRLARVVIMLVESAAIYSVHVTVLITLNATGFPAMFIFLNSLPPVIGIVFSSVILRVGSGVSTGDGESNAVTASIRFTSSGVSTIPPASKRGARVDFQTLSDARTDETPGRSREYDIYIESNIGPVGSFNV